MTTNFYYYYCCCYYCPLQPSSAPFATAFLFLLALFFFFFSLRSNFLRKLSCNPFIFDSIWLCMKACCIICCCCCTCCCSCMWNMSIMGIILEDANANANAIAALLASSIVMDEANLSIDLTIENLFSESEFSIFSFNKEGSKLFFAFFLAGCWEREGCCSCYWAGCIACSWTARPLPPRPLQWTACNTMGWVVPNPGVSSQGCWAINGATSCCGGLITSSVNDSCCCICRGWGPT